MTLVNFKAKSQKRVYTSCSFHPEKGKQEKYENKKTRKEWHPKKLPCHLTPKVPLATGVRLQVVAHAHPFPEQEPVTCVSICSEAAYQELRGWGQGSPRKMMKRGGCWGMDVETWWETGGSSVLWCLLVLVKCCWSFPVEVLYTLWGSSCLGNDVLRS